MKVIQGILLLVFLGAAGIFAVQNTDSVTVHFLKWGLSSSMALVIVAVYLLGMLTGWVVVAFLTQSIRRVVAHDDERHR